MDVSIIIVSYNTKGLLADCLDSIKDKTSGIEYETIVVDNDSKDGTQSMIKENYPWVKLIESKDNLGFGKANNLGASHAKGKYLFLLNSDTIILNNAIKYFFDYSEKNPDFGALGAILLDSNKSTCHSYGKFPTARRTLFQTLAKYLRFLKNNDLYTPQRVDNPKPVEYITGADLWIPRVVYNELEGFDSKFFMYFEEADLQKRMDNKGLRRKIIPGPEIIHLEGGSDKSATKIWSQSRLKNYYASEKIYQKKHFNKYTYPFFYILNKILISPLDLVVYIKNRFYK